MTTTEPAPAEALRDGGHLTLKEALASPCDTCAEVPCCQYLPLHTFTVETLRDVDYVRYLLNFEGIEVGINAVGTWSAYYRAACRFLGDGGRCALHGTAEKPHICVQYDPYACWYRPALTGDGNDTYLRVDRARFDVVTGLLGFDERRRISQLPLWDDLVERFASMPVTDARPAPSSTAASGTAVAGAYERWREVSLGRRDERVRVPSTPRGGIVLDSPCHDCAAPCCTTLLFPATAPVTASNLDYLRFALGFPGVEVVVTGEEWQLAVSTGCRHHADGRCTVFGTDERPIRCQYLDAWTCGYRATFDLVPSPAATRFRLEELPAVLACFAFDEAGVTIAVPPDDVIRASIEASWSTA